MSQYDVLLIGRTPVGAVLARRLVETGRSVALIDDGMAPGMMGSVRWTSLLDLGVAEHTMIEHWPALHSFADRLLLEDGSLKAVYRSDRLLDRANRYLVADSTTLVNAIVNSAEGLDHGSAIPANYVLNRGAVTGVRFTDGNVLTARLTIVTSGNRILLGAKDDTLPNETAPPFFEQVEIVWPVDTGNAADANKRTMLRGGPLAEVDGVAAVFSLPDRIALSVVVPAASLVREAVVLTDVIDRFLAHPALADVPELSAASGANVRLLTLPGKVNLERFGPGYAVLSAMEGLADPVSFDRELNLAQAVAAELCVEPVDRLGMVSSQATITAVVQESESARRPNQVRAGHIDADWVLDDPDQLGALLARMARLSPAH